MISKIVFGIFILLLTGCTNEIEEELNQVCTSSCVVIEGRFTTEDGTIGVDNLPLELSWRNTSTLGGTRRRIATGKTDENGNYSFSFFPREEELNEGSFSILFQVNDNYLIQKETNYIKFFGINSRDTLINRNYHLPTKAKLRLLILNPTAITEPDYLSGSVFYEKDDLENNIWVQSGGLDTRYNNEQTTLLDAAGNQYTYIEVQKRKNGIIEEYLDSLIVPTNEELTYELRF